MRVEGEGVCVRVEKGEEMYEGGRRGCVCVCEEKKWGRKMCVKVQKRKEVCMHV